MRFNEDKVVQEPIAEYFARKLDWETVNVEYHEEFGPQGTLGRESKRDTVLIRELRAALETLNPNLPAEAYHEAVTEITRTTASQTMEAVNREKYQLLREGVPVTYTDAHGNRKKDRLRVFDFDEALNNRFLLVRELNVHSDLYQKRPDMVGFVNGLPLMVMECKNIYVTVKNAYDENFKDYKDTVPHLFHFNAFIIFTNNNDAKIGTITSQWEHFHQWKRLTEDDAGTLDIVTMMEGVCRKHHFMDLFENFILFDTSRGATAKILARNHQYMGVNRAYEAVKNRNALQGKLGVFWHTQGAGKSYSMVMLTRKVRRKLGNHFTFVILTDREDLDHQIYGTFTGCGAADHDRDPCRATKGEHLKELLTQQKPYIFSLIQKFHQEVEPGNGYTQRDDIIVITDEAHRTQNGELAANMRNALPNAAFIGFTGTPLFKNDELTRQTFGNYISTYNFQRAVEDNATVPLYYDSRGDKLGIATDDINERIAEVLDNHQTDDIDELQKLEGELKRDYHLITAEKRLDQAARDFVRHYSTAWESGKAMLVCIDKITCVRMYNLIDTYWDQRINTLEKELETVSDPEEKETRTQQLTWMRETQKAVILSPEQGEVDRFRKWGLDITPHRRLIKQGIDLPLSMRNRPGLENLQHTDLDSAFKAERHPFRIAIVCAMWLTGFDVPSLGTLYLDKPLKEHTLMQAIARANRVNGDKPNGLIVDYCGILSQLRRALAIFAVGGDVDPGERGPLLPNEELPARLKESIQMVRDFLAAGGQSLDDVLKGTGFDITLAVNACKNVINQNDVTRKRFEVLSRAVFIAYKACVNIDDVYHYRKPRNAVNLIYQSLKEDRDKADLSEIMRRLHAVVDEAVDTRPDLDTEERKPYDISKIDFDRLRREFERSINRNTTVQNLREAVERRLDILLRQNPMRTDFQAHYRELAAAYNREKDRVVIEQTFEALLRFVEQLGEEETRAAREGLTEETLAVFDLLAKPELKAAEIKRIKEISVELLARLKAEPLKAHNWREKESTKDAVKRFIGDYLYSEKTGLPIDDYTEDEVNERTAELFLHIYNKYPTVPSPYYDTAPAA